MSADFNDHDLERLVLGAWAHGQGIESALGLVAEDFHDPRHAAAFGVMLEHAEAARPAELEAFGRSFVERGLEHLLGDVLAVAYDAYSFTSPQEIEHLADRLRELAHLRRLDEELARGRRGLRDPELTYAERVDAVADALPAALDSRRGAGLGTAEVLAREALALHQRTRDGSASGAIPTGFASLDESIGGLVPGRLVVLAARTAHGKTTATGDVCLGALHAGVPTLVVSLEQPRLELFLGILQKTSGLTPSCVREGYVETNELEQALGEIQELPLVIESGGSSLRRLTTLIRRARLAHRVELVIVDYLQLVANRLPGQTRSTEVAGVSAELKRLAVDLDVCVLACAQLNKGPEEREGGRPRITDIRESEAIAHDADQVIFLVRPDLRGDSGSPYLSVAKNRHGKTVSKIPLLFEPERNSYREMTLRAVG